MSVKNAVAFMQKVSEDESVYLEVKKLQPADFDGLLQVASTAGFPFSLDEWKEAVGNVNAKGELNDEQLDNVAGGTLYTSFTISPSLTSFTSFGGGLVAKCKRCDMINGGFGQFGQM